MTTTTTTDATAPAQLEDRLELIRPRVRDLAATVTGSHHGPPDLLAGGLETVASLALLMAAEIRGEALR